MKLIVSKLVCWPVQMAIVNQMLSKGVVPTSILLMQLIIPCTLQVPLNLTCNFHVTITTPSAIVSDFCLYVNTIYTATCDPIANDMWLQ